MTVVRLGAWCDLVTEEEYRTALRSLVGVPVEGFEAVSTGVTSDEVRKALEQFRRGLSFRVQEFATLDDGRRLTLHDERGFGVGGHPASEDPWAFLTLAGLEADVRTTVLPDDDDTGDEHPYEWLAGLLRLHNVEASPDQLRLLPYDVVFSERLRARVAGPDSGC